MASYEQSGTEIDEFLQSVPAISAFLSTKTATDRRAEIFEAIQLDQNQDSKPDNFELRNLTALVLQGLSLVLQSYLRRPEAPFRFEFLATPIYDFVLKDIIPIPHAPKVYTPSQALSCLADMLREEVLVFGVEERLSQGKLDVIATSAQVAAMRGPAEFGIERNTSGGMTLSGIKTYRGIIEPTDNSAGEIPRWQWMSMDEVAGNNIQFTKARALILVSESEWKAPYLCQWGRLV